MSKVVKFIFNNIPVEIQYNEDDLMKKICQEFADKLNKDINTLLFLYDGREINFQFTLNQQAKDSDRKEGKISILVFSKLEDNNKKKELKIKDIICPKCGEICLFKIEDYKITLYECKNNHKYENILLDEYENIENINLSKIICNICKNANIKNTFNNEFYKCISCDKNICPLCKVKHNKEHNIINYNQKNYICKNHNENYNSFCNKCKINLCILCESEHEHKNNITYYENIISKKEIIKNQIDELKIKININEKIKEIINQLNKISKNMEIYYNINYNLYEIFDKKNRNYELLKNINEIINNNKRILNELNEIINNNKIINLLNIYNKMNEKINNKEYNINKNEIISKYAIKKGDKRIKIFGNEFIKNNKNNFDFYINEKKSIIRDEVENVFWEENDEMIEIKIIEKNRCINMKNMFDGCTSLISISNESKWNTYYITDMSFMFNGCKNLKELPDISNWNTINVKDMSYMFRDCSTIKEMKNINKLKTDNVKNMSYMFYGCLSLISLSDISKWNMNNNIDISYMFYECSLLSSLPELSKWNTNSFIDISYLFFNCKELKELPDISKWNINKITKINNLFYGCSSLKQIPDISNWNTNNIINMKSLFCNCSSLISLPDITKWNTNNVLYMNYLFDLCLSLPLPFFNFIT